MAVFALVDRDVEVAHVRGLIEGVPMRGGALVVQGEAGIGKSCLLAEAARHAADRGMRVLATSGVQCEMHLPYAGLHQLLRPVLSVADDLPTAQRGALFAAFGLTGDAAPDQFVIALAALDLLGAAATDRPVLLLVEDAQWLDRPTCDALAFAGRRLESEPVAGLIAIRDGYDSPLIDAGLAVLRLEGLGEEAAGALLTAHAPGLAPVVRGRLLREAAGNPLALVELPAGLGPEQLTGAAGLPTRLPLTARLERAFAARVSDLPRATRTQLLVAAVNDRGSLAEVLGAAAAVDGTDQAVDALGPAVAARLVEADQTEVRFRHPLVRSAVGQAASPAERRAAHGALADVLAGDPDRQAWHRAASVVGADEDVAGALEAAAGRAQRRGAIAVAVAALERAAVLAVDPGCKAARLLRGAELAVDLGRLDLAAGLVGQVEPVELSELDRGRLAWIREMSEPGTPGDPARVRSLVETAGRVSAEQDRDLALKLLWAAASSIFWAGRRDPQLSALVVAAAEQVPGDQDDPRLLSILAYAAPIERGGYVIEYVARHAPDRAGDPEAMRLLGNAAATTGAFDLSEGFATAAAAGLRQQGELGLLAQVLVLAWAEIHLGRWNLARPDAEEATRLAAETGQPIWAAGAQVAESILAGLRGDEYAAEALAGEAERAALPIGAQAVLSVTQLARGLTALGAGRYEDAYQNLRRMFDPADPSYHPMESCWAIGNLAEAAAYSGHKAEARAVLDELEPLAAQTPSTWLHVAMRHARPLLAGDDDAEPLFQAALDADLAHWPFDRARALLAYGTWLRRQRRIAEARAPLNAAREVFDALGVVCWGEQARQELRATGVASHPPASDPRDTLSSQELQIAQMAAEGLTNREIAQQLYLSHRTVGAHLCRIFPKLGITSRAQLASALRSEASSPA